MDIFVLFGWACAAILILLPLVLFVPLKWAMASTVPIMLILFLVQAKSGKTSALGILSIVLAPVLLLLILYATASMISSRLVLGSVFSIAGLILFYRYSREPLDFCKQWLCAEPHLRPETRVALLERPTPKCSLALVLALFAVTLFLPNPLFTIVPMAVLLLSFLVLLIRDGLRPTTIEALRDLMTLYSAYDPLRCQAPGVWQPKASMGRRRQRVVFISLSVFVPLMVNLTLFMPEGIAMPKFANTLVSAHQHKGEFLEAINTAFPDITWANLYRLDVDDLGMDSTERAILFWQTELGDSPHSSLVLAIGGILHGELGYLWFFPVAVIGAIVYPSIMLLLVYRRPLAELARLSMEVDALDQDDPPRTEWQCHVDRLLGSTHEATDPVLGTPVAEADHLFMGVEPYQGFPVLLHRPILREHTYIVGDSGSGKTTLGILPILLQLLQTKSRQSNDETKAATPAIIILDLKGDAGLFHATRRAAHAAGRRFLHFTTEAGRSSYRFNPFLNIDGPRRTPVQFCELVLDSLSLTHGSGYGRSYYTRQSRHALLHAIKAGNQPSSFADLYRTLEDMVTEPEFRDCFELLSTVQSLTEYESLNYEGSPDSEAHIYMPRVLNDREVVYFWLPAALESVSVREIGKLALFSILSAAIDRDREGHDNDAVLVIDEFQRIASDNFRIVLEQARAFGLSTILANQSQADMNTPDVDLRTTIRTNTRTKMYFSISDPAEMRALSDVSGEELFYAKTWQIEYFRGFFQPNDWATNKRTEAESLKPRITSSDIIRSTDHPTEYLLHVNRGGGYTQFGGMPVPVRTSWPFTKPDYDALARTPWPDLEDLPDTTAIVQQHRSSEAIDQEARQRAAAAAQSALENLWATKEKLLRRQTEPATE